MFQFKFLNHGDTESTKNHRVFFSPCTSVFSCAFVVNQFKPNTTLIFGGSLSLRNDPGQEKLLISFSF